MFLKEMQKFCLGKHICDTFELNGYNYVIITIKKSDGQVTYAPRSLKRRKRYSAQKNDDAIPQKITEIVTPLSKKSSRKQKKKLLNDQLNQLPELLSRQLLPSEDSFNEFVAMLDILQDKLEMLNIIEIDFGKHSDAYIKSRKNTVLHLQVMYNFLSINSNLYPASNVKIDDVEYIAKNYNSTPNKRILLKSISHTFRCIALHDRNY